MSDVKRDSLIEALAEAERFVKRGKVALKGFHRVKSHDDIFEWWRYESVAFAAAKRSSMDLTRALARLRRGC